MKRAMISLGKASRMMVVALVALSLNLSAYASSTTHDVFTIKALDNASPAPSWNLQYAASDNGFTISMTERNGEKEYTVRSKFFEIAYVLNKNGFGARTVKNSQARVPVQILSQILNRDELSRQRLITNEQINDEAALNLIASFMPELINENYKHLLN